MGLPSLVVTIADNQKALAAELDRRGLIINLGWHKNLTIEQISLTLQELIIDQSKRYRMYQIGRNLVDGNGLIRIISKMVHTLP